MIGVEPPQSKVHCCKAQPREFDLGDAWLWKKMRAIIEKTFADWPGTLYVYEEYVPEE